MKLKGFQFASLLLVALSLAAGMAHLFALPNKMMLSAEDYRTVQQIYRGWALLGVVIFGALLSTLVLTLLARGRESLFWLSLAALCCVAGSLIVFFALTYPANQATDNWTRLPANWLELRRQWEYSHAAGALLYLTAFILLLISVLGSKR